jgi:hypothetical protein
MEDQKETLSTLLMTHSPGKQVIEKTENKEPNAMDSK